MGKGKQVLGIGRTILVLGFIIPFLLQSCAPFLRPAPSPHNTSADFKGGVLVTFDVNGQAFNVWIVNSETIQQVVKVYRGETASLIPFGSLMKGPGENNHNSPYNWHLDPVSVQLVVAPPDQKCIDTPTLTDKYLDKYVNEGAFFCPSAAKLIKYLDYRIPPPATLKGN